LKRCGKRARRHGEFGKYGRSNSNNINMSDLILTILVPTRNRAACLQDLLKSFLGQKISNDVEILIAINASNDGSLEVVKHYQQNIPYLNIKYFAEFLHSAEENISRSIQYCRGKYVFILGDDDAIIWDNFDVMFSILKNDQSNIPALIFNNISSVNKLIKFSDHIKIETKSQISFLEMDNKIASNHSYGDLLRDLGPTTIMAFISRYVIRKDLLGDFSGHIKISRIYSHVFALLEFLHKENLMLIDLPLTIRGDSVVDERFKTLSDSTSQSTFFSWNQGLLLHINAAIRNKFISSSWFFEVKEFRDDGLSFSLWRRTLDTILSQIMKYLEDLEKNEKMSRESIDILRSFDSNSLSPLNRRILDYTLSEMEEILFEINQDNLSKKSRKFFTWEARKLIELLSNRNSLKANNSKTLRVKKLLYSKMLKMPKLKIFSEALFFRLRKEVKKIEMMSLTL